MTIKGDRSADRAECLSALVDGELEASDAQLACAQWREDLGAQERWHCYQLIGDVLRSDDLASTPARDRAFLDALRQRLDAEPIVLAPAPLAEPTSLPGGRPGMSGTARTRRAWFMPSAVAATLAAVVVGGVITSRQPGTAPTQIATVQPVPVPVAADDATEPALTVANGRLIRDARLDRYLAAHQQWSGGSVVGGHAAYLRQASAEAPARVPQR